jgi:hypothetical protein
MGEGFAFFCWVRLKYPNLARNYFAFESWNACAQDMWRRDHTSFPVGSFPEEK